MRAQVGDHIVLTATRVDDPTRHGEVLEVGDPDGGPPWTVRWSDGHIGVFYPGPGSVRSIEAPDSADAAPSATVPGAEDAPPAPASGHVHEWTVRVSLFESGDDTSASVVLLSDAPTHLTAHGESRRSTHDPDVPEIGDEVAVARALRHLADRLLDAAEEDIEAMTGEPAQVRRV